MEANNIIAAPQVCDTTGIYALWSIDHDGTLDAFYRFMTTPSTRRDSFIAANRARLAKSFIGPVLTLTLTPQ